MNVGQRIVALRTAQGLKQRALALKAGISQGHLSDIENGHKDNLGLDTLDKIASALNVTRAELLGEEGTTEMGELALFWKMRFAALKHHEIATHREDMSTVDRIAWATQQLVEAFGASRVAALLDLPSDTISVLLAGKIKATEKIVDIVAERAHLPAKWLSTGDPGPIDEVLWKIMRDPDAGAWLTLIAEAMDARLSPELVKHQIDGLLKARNQKPLATD